MIIKVMNRKAEQTVSDVRALLRYIRGERVGDGDKVLVGYGGATGFGLSGDADVGMQQILLERLVEENRASTRPLMHVMLSWDTGVEPSPAEVRAAVGIWLQEIGATGLPAVWEVHGNTAHVHAHVMLCRLDPADEGRARDLGLFKLRSQRAKTKIEARQGLTGNQQDLFIPVPGGDVQPNPDARYWRNGAGAPDVMPPLAQGAAASEQRTGEESAQRRAQEEAWPRISAAGSWEDVHASLAEIGCQLVRRKGGLSMLVRIGAKEYHVRASHVHRGCSRKSLESRLGAYRPPAEPEAGVESSATAFMVPRSASETGKAKPKPERNASPALEAVPETAPSSARPAPGMDDELSGWWALFRQAEETEARTRRIWAEARASERRAVRERVRAETRRASQLVREARRRGERLVRGVMTAFRKALEEDARQRRKTLSARQEVEALGAPRRAESFAGWLERQGRPELAERWRRRGAVPVVAEGAGRRLTGTVLTKTALPVWRPGWSLPVAGKMLEARITASVPESKPEVLVEPAGAP
ncbi:MAG: relaxase/mobilization nuclease domain-containing protein, partial [Desulfovibrio sp.]|nr:relaxase/mobilization nuclease domain-containing protein [Desulfovibrio sp.]